MFCKVWREHEQVLKTMQAAGLLTRQAMKSIRGQVLSMDSSRDREIYLKRVIANVRR
jgi:hypothetical protein